MKACEDCSPLIFTHAKNETISVRSLIVRKSDDYLLGLGSSRGAERTANERMIIGNLVGTNEECKVYYNTSLQCKYSSSL